MKKSKTAKAFKRAIKNKTCSYSMKLHDSSLEALYGIPFWYVLDESQDRYDVFLDGFHQGYIAGLLASKKSK